MRSRPARPDDIEGLAALIDASRPADGALPPASRDAIVEHIRRDLDAPQGQFGWLILEDGTAAIHIAVIPPPPIYEGGIVGVMLGHWTTSGGAAEQILAAAETHFHERRVTKLIGAAPAGGAMASALQQHAYRPTVHYMAKRLTNTTPAEAVRTAAVSDIPALVAFNREARARLHEANPDFWLSHAEADTRFGLWMKFSLTMRDRSMLMSDPGPGFIIAQPASPIQLPITADAQTVGVIDDFHDATFGTSLRHERAGTSGAELLAAAENDFIARGKTAALAICPAAWTAKQALLVRAGYTTNHLWFVKPL
ncbi:MAG: hypothetical protein KBA31_12795 [Alphaproteobacteria bacterium]|nr:hypothetical protein [Alphaproteobacteria bacterium]